MNSRESFNIAANFEIVIDYREINLKLAFKHEDTEACNALIENILLNIESFRHKFIAASGRIFINTTLGMLPSSENEKKISLIDCCLNRRVMSAGKNILILLSVVNDAITILEKNNVSIKFKISDIINEFLSQAENKSFDIKKSCVASDSVERLQTILKNSQLSCADAIHLAYCLEESDDLSDLDLPQFFKEPTLENIVALAKEFSTKKWFPRNFFDNVSIWQRIRLFSPCLGMKADDGGLFSWDYTEWTSFFAYADFNNNGAPNGDCHINVEENSAYQEFYIEGKKGHPQFAKEMLKLSEYIDIKVTDDLLNPDNPNWHKKITLTSEASKKIIDMGLVEFPKNSAHISFIKPIIRAKNNYQFFQQVCRQRDHSILYAMPNDVIGLIWTYAFGPMISPTEKLAAMKLSSLRLFSDKKTHQISIEKADITDEIKNKILLYQDNIQKENQSLIYINRGYVRWWTGKINVLTAALQYLNKELSAVALEYIENENKGWDQGVDAIQLVNKVKTRMGLPLNWNEVDFNQEEKREFRL